MNEPRAKRPERGLASPPAIGFRFHLRATELGDPWSKLRLMAIHPDLLEILVCPVCKTEVQPVKDGAGLRCVQCKRVYPVKDDIPIMLEDEASIEG